MHLISLEKPDAQASASVGGRQSASVGGRQYSLAGASGFSNEITCILELFFNDVFAQRYYVFEDDSKSS